MSSKPMPLPDTSFTGLTNTVPLELVSITGGGAADALLAPLPASMLP